MDFILLVSMDFIPLVNYYKNIGFGDPGGPGPGPMWGFPGARAQGPMWDSPGARAPGPQIPNSH